MSVDANCWGCNALLKAGESVECSDCVRIEQETRVRITAEEDAKAQALAVVISTEYDGWVIHARGHWLEREVENASHVDDVGLPEPKHAGILVWEGDFRWEHVEDADIIARGAYRQPTDAEWEAIKAGRNPFA